MKRALCVLVLAGCHEFGKEYQDCVDRGACAAPGSGGGVELPLVLEPAPTSVDLGVVVVGDSADASVVITNASERTTLPLTTGFASPAQDFALAGCNSVLLRSGSCTLEITYAPTVPGDAGTTVQIGEMMGTSTPLSVPLAATAIPQAVLTADMTSVALSANAGVRVGPAPVRITNTSPTTTTAPLVWNITAGGFSFDGGCISAAGLAKATLGPTESCRLELYFDGPSTVIDAIGTLSVHGRSSEAVAVDLVGHGLGVSVFTFTPPTLAFDFVDGGSSLEKMVTVKNTGAGATTAPAFDVTPDGGPFSITSNGCPQGLASMDTCTMGVTFAPPHAGPFLGSLGVRATVGGMSALPLTGTGIDDLPVTVIAPAGGSIGWTGGNVCPTACTGLARRGATVAFSPQAAAGQFFHGWTNDCASAGLDASCMLTVANDGGVTVGAMFGYPLVTVRSDAGTLRDGGLAGRPGGTISGLPGACTPPCSYSIDSGVTLNLYATPSLGYQFLGWDPPCTGRGTCTVSVPGGADLNLSAAFQPVNIAFLSPPLLPGPGGGFTGVAGGDQVCANLASDAGLRGATTGVYRAALANTWSSVGPYGRINNFGAEGWVRADNRPLGNASDFSAGLQWYPMRASARGLDLAGTPDVRVNIGKVSSDTCGDFSGNTAGLNTCVVSGASVGPLSGETQVQCGVACSTPMSIICMGMDLSNTVLPPQPPPPTARLAFVSQRDFWALTSDVAADNNCRAEATAQGLPGASTFIAFRSRTGQTAISRVNTAGAPWYQTNGVQLVRVATDIGGANILSPLNRIADGGWNAAVPSRRAWTGEVTPSGVTMPAYDCTQWTSIGGDGGSIWFGHVNQPVRATDWFSGGGPISGVNRCDVDAGLLCLQP